MDLNEIKKALYKEKPTAKGKETLTTESANGIQCTHVWSCELKSGLLVEFHVPQSEMKGAEFYDDLEAHLLIRWLKLPEAR